MKSALSGDLDVEKDAAYSKLKSKQEGSAKAKGVLRGAGYARGGGVSPVKKTIKVDGKKAGGRADKYKRGGSVPRGKHAGHHTKINIAVGAGEGEKQQAMQKGVQMGARMMAQKMAGAPRPAAGAPMQARPMPPPPAAGPAPGSAPPPAGAPPMMRKCGGRTYKRGGPVRVPGTVHLPGGAGGAEGRLAKIKAYGGKHKKS